MSIAKQLALSGREPANGYFHVMKTNFVIADDCKQIAIPPLF